MKEHMNNTHGLPTEATLKHLAEQGDAEQLKQTLEWLRKAGGAQALAEKAEAAGMSIELYDIFKAARQGLTDLEAARPSITKPLAEQEAGDPFAEGHRFEETIGAFLGHLGGEVGRITADPEDEKAAERSHPLDVLHDALDSEDRRKIVFAQVRELGEVDREWLGREAFGVVEGVKENLWNVVLAGRDFASEARSENPGAERLHELGVVWGEEIDDGLRGAAFELDDAIRGLEA